MFEFIGTLSNNFSDYPAIPLIVEYIAAILTAFLVYAVISFVVVPRIIKVTKKTSAVWDDFLVAERVPQTAAALVSLSIFLGFFDTLSYHPFFLKTLIVCGIIITVLIFVFRLVNFLVRVYNLFPVAKRIPIKSFGQLFKIISTIIAGILMVSVFSGKSPLLILSGIGAVSAVLIFVFKDTIMSFIAGIQISGLNIMAVGDWIESPAFNANGEVIEISLYTVKIQNWDHSISLIPLNKIFDTNIKNWRGMQEKGLRRVSRCLNIDINSIRALTVDEIENFKKVTILADYINQKTADINTHNTSLEANGVDITEELNIRRLTNIGTFRAYMLNYLKNHPDFSQSSTLMVHHQSPGERGVSLCVYGFITNTGWVFCEDTLSDIFDHFLLVGNKFGLTFFQNPTGIDFRKNGIIK